MGKIGRGPIELFSQNLTEGTDENHEGLSRKWRVQVKKRYHVGRLTQ
jgi:hypothetical protein